MLPLQTRAQISGTPRRTVLKVLTLTEFIASRREPEDCALWLDNSEDLRRSRALTDLNWGAVVDFDSASPTPSEQCTLTAPRIANIIAPGDVIRVNSHSRLLSVLYRRGSRNNSLFVTERCNSYCLMCSQPPVDHDDSHRVSELLNLIPLIDTEEQVLGITGGEPTLLGDRLQHILGSLKANLPDTRIHALSNGRRFSDDTFARSLAAVEHPGIIWAIPLYSDAPEIHDYVVQSERAFHETLTGLLNLASLNQRIEIRFVIQQATVPRMRQLAHFIARNLTFVDHVAWMGLEPMGFARPNWKQLWIEPEDYVSALEDAVFTLHNFRIPTSIYNIPLCVLPGSLHEFAAQSISDWKNRYLPECETCQMRSRCCGFFTSATREHLPRNIRPQELSS